MSSDIIVCPSGLSGVIRGLTGKSMRLLSDKQAQRNGVMLDKILADCWQDTTDPGPYTESISQTKNADGQVVQKPDWSKVLIGDRMYALFQIRSRSFGSKFEFKQQCPSRDCRQSFHHELDLNDLPVQQLSEEDRVAFSSGNRLLGHLPDGRSFVFRLLTGADEAKLARVGADYLGALKSRILEVDGLTNELAKNKYFDEAEISVLFDAIAEMDQHDCGVNTKISVECPDCREEIDITIPFEQGFLSRPKKS